MKCTQGVCAAGKDIVVASCKKQARTAGLPRKHSCPDCGFCQFCSDARCQSCLSGAGDSNNGCSKKMSFSEQIQLYDRINKEDPFIGKRCR
ncbi:MAG: hypothetical protein ABFD97_12605 [Syntrophobacter sp.]